VMMIVVTSCNKEELLQNNNTFEERSDHFDERSLKLSEFTNDSSNQLNSNFCFSAVRNGCSITVNLDNNCIQYTEPGWYIVFDILDENFNIIDQQIFSESDATLEGCPTPCSYTFKMDQCGTFLAGGYIQSSAGTVMTFNDNEIYVPYMDYKGTQFCWCSIGPVPVNPGIFSGGRP